ncbi:MAG TPA: hypothetical protein VLL76_05555 [Candidatus Omnitrophota bacterium]|nr:hypothetical protein [Candidatus Omnitrophota bacterium]
MAGRQVYFEFMRQGAYMKVVAIDSVTATEVTIVGPAGASQEQLKLTALRKLEYVLSKQGK